VITTSYSALDFALADFMSDRCGFVDDKKERFNSIILSLSSEQSAGHSLIGKEKQQSQLQSSPLPLLRAGQVRVKPQPF